MVGEGQRFLFLKRNHMGFNGRPAQPKAADKLVVTGEKLHMTRFFLQTLSSLHGQFQH